MISEYERQYINNLSNILTKGIREKNERTGIVTLRLPATQIVVDLEKEFPILKSKKVFWKSAVKEILWIMQAQSNVTADLDSHIWDQWTGEDGTIGKSYGYQVNKPVLRKDGLYANQVSYVLRKLQEDPSNRQAVINMWNVEELSEMNLVPCVYSSVWNIIDGRLNCMLVQRSADYPVGVPFDTTQYAILTHLFANHLGVRPGILTHVMADSHIYENQIEGVREQLRQYDRMFSTNINVVISEPKLEIDNSNFWEVELKDIHVKDYESMPVIKYEVAV